MDFLRYLENDVLEDDLEILDILQFGFPRRIYERSNYYEDLDNLQFFQRFRLTKPSVLNVLMQIEDQLEYPHDLNDSVSPINQLLSALRFFATGGHIASVADYMGMHTSTASRIISKVSGIIAGLRTQYVNMPERNEIIEVQNDFFSIAAFPRVIGCIDGTHIRIQSPGGDDGELFRNRKSYFSINTQIIGDSQLKIRDIVARWPGSAHDATIFNQSSIRARFEDNNFENSVLLGDSGYFLTPYLLTPLLNPVNGAENLYNDAHIRTRNTVERLFGLWKRRFPVLAYGMRVSLNTALKIIVACAVLHNVAINMREEVPPVPQELDVELLNYLIQVGNIPNIAVMKMILFMQQCSQEIC